MNKTTEFYDQFKNQILLYENRNNYQNITNKNLINLVHTKLEQKDNLDVELLNQILTPEKILKEFLIFDLLNYHPENSHKIENMNDAINFTIETLKKYQYKIGGFYIEDNDWILSDKDSYRFKVKENQKILYNSVSKKSFDRELVWFLDSVTEYIRRFVNQYKIEVKYNIYEDEKNCICWIIFKFNDHNFLASIREKIQDQLEERKEKEEGKNLEGKISEENRDAK
jgi:hypothetical protein